MNLNMQTPHKQRGWINFVIGGALALGSAISGRKSRKAQNAARRQQQQANRLKNLQSKREFLRNFRQQQAAAVASGIAGGTTDSSISRATQSSQRAQASVAGAEFGELNRLGEAASANLNRAATQSYNAGIYGQLAGFALSDTGGNLINKFLG